MKKLSVVFGLFAIILSNVMCAVVAFNYRDMLYVDDYYNQIYMFTGMKNYGDLAAISFVGMTESTGYTSEPTCTEDGVETRYCEHCDATETRTIDSHCASESFVDVNLDDWFHTAVGAMQWAVENGIITGMTADTLDPKGTSTRAQIATILMRFMELGK